MNTFALYLLAGFLTYSNCISNPFMIDDHSFFNHPTLKISFHADDPYGRPLARFIPILFYTMFGDHPEPFHIINILFLCLSGYVIFWFVRKYLNAPQLAAQICGILYILHPIHSMVPNYITASIFPLQIICMLLSLHFITQDKYKLIACGLFLIAISFHETALLLPLYALVLFRSFKKTKALWITLGMVLFLRLFYVPLHVSLLAKIHQIPMSFAQYTATWTKILFWYLSNLIWPHDIVLIMSQQPLTNNILPWNMVLITLIVASGYLLWKYRANKIRFLGLSWFILGFLPFTIGCFFAPVQGLMIEPHWFLFPIIGLFIFIADVIYSFWRTKKILAQIVLGILLCGSFLSCRYYNWVWGNEIRYCNYWLSKSPDFVTIHAFLAKAYQRSGQHDLSRKHYIPMIKYGYNLDLIYEDLGTMALQDGRWEEAKEYFLKLEVMRPNSVENLCNLGVAYFGQKQYSQALVYFNRAHQINPDFAPAKLNIEITNKILKVNGHSK